MSEVALSIRTSLEWPAGLIFEDRKAPGPSGGDEGFDPGKALESVPVKLRVPALRRRDIHLTIIEMHGWLVMVRDLPNIDYERITGRDRVRLRTLEIALAAGLSQAANRFLGLYDELVAASPSTLARSYWECLKGNLHALKEVEAIHGVGAALDLQHASVVRLLAAKRRDGSPAISEDMLLAARKYSKKHKASAPAS